MRSFHSVQTVFFSEPFTALEVQKLERRKWIYSRILTTKEEESILPLNLPVPSKSPSIVNMVPDFKSKKLFLQLLGLKNINAEARQEMERDWMSVVQERMRRNCESPVTKYSLKVYNNALNNNTKNCGLAKNSCSNSLDMFFKVPIVHQYNLANLPSNFTQDCINLNATENVEYNCVPLKIMLQNQNCKNLFIQNDAKPIHQVFNANERSAKGNVLIWPGIEDIMLAYNRYAKERNYEIEQLRIVCSSLKEEISLQQCGASYYEKRQRELHSIVFMNEKRRKQLQKSIDQLTNIINAFR